MARVAGLLYLYLYFTVSLFSASGSLSDGPPAWLCVLEITKSGLAFAIMLLCVSRWRPESLKFVWKIAPFLIVAFDAFLVGNDIISLGQMSTELIVTILTATVFLFPSWYLCFRFGFRSGLTPGVPGPGAAPNVRSTAKRIAAIATLALVVVVPVYGGFYALLIGFQESLIFAPSTEVPRDPGDLGMPFEEFGLDVDGSTTFGWFIPSGESLGQWTVLFSHGNGGNVASQMDHLGILRELGFNVAVYDYGGYGKSTGTPTEARCYADIRAVWDYLVNQRGIAPSSIVLHGHSMGGGPTAQLATEVEAGAVVIESAFLSIEDMAGAQYPLIPLFPVSRFIRHQFANIDKVAAIDEPILHVHSRDDEAVSYDQGKALFSASTDPNSFLEIQGDHDTGFVTSGAPYIDGLASFFFDI